MKIKVKSTKAIQALLRDAAADESLSEEVRSEAKSWSGESAVRWDSLKRIVHAVRNHHAEKQLLYQENRSGPPLHPPDAQLCRGSFIVVDTPPPRRPQYTPEFRALLDRLRKNEEERMYNAMVADVAQEGLGNEVMPSGGMSTYRQQISFGLHIIVTMGAFYAFGHVSGAALFPQSANHYVVGLVMMVLALFLETTLFIIRSTVPPKLKTTGNRGSRVVQSQKKTE